MEQQIPMTYGGLLTILIAAAIIYYIWSIAWRSACMIFLSRNGGVLVFCLLGVSAVLTAAIIRIVLEVL